MTCEISANRYNVLEKQIKMTTPIDPYRYFWLPFKCYPPSVTLLVFALTESSVYLSHPNVWD